MGRDDLEQVGPFCLTGSVKERKLDLLCSNTPWDTPREHPPPPTSIHPLPSPVFALPTSLNYYFFPLPTFPLFFWIIQVDRKNPDNTFHRQCHRPLDYWTKGKGCGFAECRHLSARGVHKREVWRAFLSIIVSWGQNIPNT